MMEWDSRMHNTRSVQVLKAAIPFFDVSVGEQIDMEGLLSAVRPFSSGRERKMLDLFLQFFQMRRMMEMMQVMQSMQQAQERAGETPADPFDLLKTMLPAEEQETLDMVSSMMAMMQSSSPDSDVTGEQAPENDKKGEDGEYEGVDF